MESDYGISIVALFFVFLPLVARLWADRLVIKVHKIEVEHGLHTFLTALMMLACAYAVNLLDHVSMFKAFMLEWGVFWFFFDPVLNLLLGKNWYYIDENVNDKKGKFAKIEQFYNRLGIWNTLFIRSWWMLFTFAIYFYSSYIG